MTTEVEFMYHQPRYVTIEVEGPGLTEEEIVAEFLTQYPEAVDVEILKVND